MRGATAGVILSGLVLTAALAVMAGRAIDDTESRLLRQRAREAALVLQGQIAQIEAPIVLAGAALRAAGGDPQAFRQQMAPFVEGPEGDGVFAAAALVQVEPVRFLAEVGEAVGGFDTEDAGEALDQAATQGGIHVADLVGAGGTRRLGVVAGPRVATGRVIYVEVGLPDRPGDALQGDVAFSDVDAAVYLSPEERPDEVLLSTTADLPVDGEHATQSVPLGQDEVHLVLAARGHLVDDFAAALPWAVVAVGLVATAAAAVVVAVTLRHRDEALGHAGAMERQSAALTEARRDLEVLNAELERQVERRTRQLAASNRELEAFAYSVSHDLRTPLRAVDGFTTALLEDYGDGLDDGARRYLDRVRAAAGRMGELIDDLLALSRVTRQSMAVARVDLSAEARAVVDQLRQADPERQVEVDVTDGVVVDGDRRLLRVALENLLGNAWKFTGGRDPAHIRFGVEDVDGEVVCVVADDGAGFDRDFADKLFRPFQRLHRAEEFEGTGVGLATVARVVERHGGRVWAEGAVDAGATVRFVLPGATVVGGSEQPKATAGTGSEGG